MTTHRTAIAASALLSFLPALAAAGGPPTSSWVRSWQPESGSWALGDLVAIGADGGVYTAARPDDGSGLGNAIALLRHDPDGTLAWARTVDGPPNGSEGLSDLEPTETGVAAFGGTLAASGLRPILLDYAADGTLRFDVLIDEPVTGGFLAPQLAIAPNGDRVVAFRSGTDVRLHRFASDGTPLGDVTLALPAAAGPSDLVVDAGGHAIVASLLGFDRFDVRAIAPDFTEAWSFTSAPSTLVIGGGSLALAPDGDVFLGGTQEESCVPSGIAVRARLWRLAPGGGVEWSVAVAERACDFRTLRDVLAGPDGEAYALVGRALGESSQLVRLEADGSVGWERFANEGALDVITILTQIDLGPAGDLVAVGRDTDGGIPGSGTLGLRVERYETDGDLAWSDRVLDAGDDELFVGAIAGGPVGGASSAGAVAIAGTRRPVQSGIEDEVFVLRLDFAPCPGDLDGDGTVGFADLLGVLSAFGTNDEGADLDESGTVDFADVLVLLAAWGEC